MLQEFLFRNRKLHTIYNSLDDFYDIIKNNQNKFYEKNKEEGSIYL